MTNDISKCSWYQSQSQNVKEKYYCNPPENYRIELQKRKIRSRLPNFPGTEEACKVDNNQS